MAAALIDNRAARACRCFRTVISLDYGAPIDKVVAICDAVRAFAATEPRFLPDKVEVHIVGLGANGVETPCSLLPGGGHQRRLPAATSSREVLE